MNLLAQITENIEGYITQLKAIPMSSTERQVVDLAYARSFQDVFKPLVGASILGGFFSLPIKHATLDRWLESEHVLIKLNLEENNHYQKGTTMGQHKEGFCSHGKTSSFEFIGVHNEETNISAGACWALYSCISVLSWSPCIIIWRIGTGTIQDQ